MTEVFGRIDLFRAGRSASPDTGYPVGSFGQALRQSFQRQKKRFKMSCLQYCAVFFGKMEDNEKIIIIRNAMY